MSDPVTRLNAALEGRYAIERELGEGGMATVYLADDLKHERKVALKVLKPELAAVVGAERFLAEIKTTANLQHPHILPLFDSGEADGFLFYVMPYVEGETLRDRIDREKQLPVDEAVALASKVAGALQHAHEHGVIHRDIKPGNILLQDGEPVVADFGIALAVGAAGSNRLTETGLSLGTPYYMSPEQATGDQAVGASTDTYALGSVLYEMLTGDPPYMGSTAQAVLGQIISAKPISATEKRPSIPANVDAAVRKALEKLPADRFTSAQDFVRALGDEHFRYGELAVAGTSAAVGPWKRLTMAFAALSAVTTLIAAWGWLRPGPEPGVPTRAAVTGVDIPETGGGWRLAISPDGRSILKVADGSIQIRPADDPEWRQLRNTEGGENPTFSPDGQWLAFTQDDAIKRVEVVGGPVLPAWEQGDNAHWGLDETIVFVTDGGIYQVSASGGEPHLIVEGVGSPIIPHLLPDGEAIIFQGPGSRGEDPDGGGDRVGGCHRSRGKQRK
ncbi:MAG: serine/threonine-protein kinase [Gemmatimonadetes bacterium]|nr:serine/threonine-protein kinase [Gemmatimonadota bacterium]